MATTGKTTSTWLAPVRPDEKSRFGLFSGVSTFMARQLAAWVDAQLDKDGGDGESFLAKLEAIPTRRNEFGYDPFGFHRDEAKLAILATRYLYKNYFRVDAHGVRGVPRGRVLLVSNHSGQLPFDALGIAGALLFDYDPPRIARAMIEKFVSTMPFVSYLFSRWGQITGTPENCRRLLADDEAILVFPEGARGITKPFSQRYQLQEFGLGFMRLALETRTPIVPVAVVGAEEQAPAVNLRPLARLLKMPSFPVLPLPPFVPLPYPVKYRIYFGEPLMFDGDPDDEDDVLAEKVKRVRNEIHAMLRAGLRERRNVFW